MGWPRGRRAYRRLSINPVKNDTLRRLIAFASGFRLALMVGLLAWPEWPTLRRRLPDGEIYIGSPASLRVEHRVLALHARVAVARGASKSVFGRAANPRAETRTKITARCA